MSARGIENRAPILPGATTRTRSLAALPRRVLRAAGKQPVHAAAALILAFTVATAVAGPYLPIADPQEQELRDRMLPPLSRGQTGDLYITGTDNLGRDTLSRTIHGARASIGIATGAVILAGISGTLLGLTAGYRGGLVDLLLMRLVDLQMAFPTMVLAILFLYLLGAGMTHLIFLLVIFSWATFARMARAQTLSLRNQAFVEGAVAVGASTPRILFRHIVPHLIPVIAIIAVFDFAGVMLAEAGLSFLGLGVAPPDVSWGLMLAQGRDHLATGGWWLIAIPGAALSLTALAANLTSRWIQSLTRIQED